MGGILGVSRAQTFRESRRLIVYPRILPLRRLGLPANSALVEVPATMPLFEDPSRLVGVREYRPGDSARGIHWGATARLDRVQVKRFHPAIARETLICLDLDARSYDVRGQVAVETAIVVAASLAHHCMVREGAATGLTTGGYDWLSLTQRSVSLPLARGHGALLEALEVLARLRPMANARFVELLQRAGATAPQGTAIIVITGQLDLPLVETALSLKRQGRPASIILVEPDDSRARAGGAIRLAGLPVHRVWSAADLAVPA